MVDDNMPTVCRCVYAGSCRGSVTAFTLPWLYKRLSLKINNDNEMTLVWVVVCGVSFCLPSNFAVYQATYGSYFSQYQVNRST